MWWGYNAFSLELQHINYYPREEKPLSSRRECIILAKVVKSEATKQGIRIRKIYINFASYSQNIYLLSSHRSHKSHRERIVDFAFGLVLLWDPKGSVVATDAFIPRRRVCHPAENTRQCRQARAKRRAFCEICEICVRLNHLCEGILVSLPWATKQG